jgi:hypothetical protein
MINFTATSSKIMYFAILIQTMENRLSGYKFKKGSGTPGSLREAISNGLDGIKSHPHLEPETVMWIHIREFLAQKFVFGVSNVPALKHLTEPKAIWNRIFPEDTQS